MHLGHYSKFVYFEGGQNWQEKRANFWQYFILLNIITSVNVCPRMLGKNHGFYLKFQTIDKNIDTYVLDVPVLMRYFIASFVIK